MSISWETVFSIALGGAISWFFTWLYYKRAGDELRQEAAALKQETTKIKQFNQEILLTLADHGLGLIALNEDGEWRRLVSGKANNITVQPFMSNTQGEVLPPE